MDCYTELRKKINKLDFKIEFWNLWENICNEHSDICFFTIRRCIFNMCGKYKNYKKYYYSITLFNFMIELSYKRKV